MLQLRRDLRFATRLLLRHPAFAALAALILGLGVGATCTVFSAVHAVLLAPSAISQPERLVMIWENNLGRDQPEVEVSFPNFLDWRAQNRVFDRVAAFPSVVSGLTVTGDRAPEKVPGTFVTEDFLPMLGVAPALGRAFAAADFQPGNPLTVLLSDSLWRERFAGDRGALGKSLNLDGTVATIIGVLPPGFDFPRGAQLFAAFVPEPGDWTAERGYRVLATMGRLKEGVTLEQARSQMGVLSSALSAAYPKENEGYGATLVPWEEYVLGSARPALWVLLGAVLLVLLMACVNVANLFLARATGRERELAVRRALGATRAQVFRQLLLETACVAVLGGAVGVLLSFWGVDLLRALAPQDIPRLDAARVSGPVLLCALAATGVTALGCGLLPALRLSQTPVLEVLKAAGRSSSGGATSRLRSALVVLQVALAVVLVSGAGLLIKSFNALMAIDPGYDASGLLTARVELNQATYTDSSKRAAIFEQFLERVRALPSVSGAALVLMRPLSGTIGWDYPFRVEGQSEAEQAQNPYSNYLAISPAYFATMRIGLLGGRDFSASDRANAPGVAIVGESMAKRFWPGQSALGKRLKFGRANSNKPWLTVVGVARDARYREWGAVRPDIYVPYLQQAEFRTDVVIRTAVPPLSLVPELRRALAQVDASQPLSEVTTMAQAVDAALARPRFNMWLLGMLASLALTLAVVGVYGVVSYGVSLRTWEIGVRMALGAQRGQVLAMVLRQGAVLGGVGVALGVPVFLSLSRLLGTLVFGVAPADAVNLGVVVVLLVVATALASALPALRAARTSPVVALRDEA